MKKLYFLAIFLFAAFLGNSQVLVKQQKESHKGTRVEMVTNYGRIVLLLYDETPLHRDNFIKLPRTVCLTGCFSTGSSRNS